MTIAVDLGRKATKQTNRLQGESIAMTIAVDLGRKATKQTNGLQGESIAGKWADRRTLLTYIPHHWGIGILLLHTPVAYTSCSTNLVG